MYLDYLKIKTQLQAGYDADVAPDKSGWNGYQYVYQEWDFCPNAIDNESGEPYDESTLNDAPKKRIEGGYYSEVKIYYKNNYVGYTSQGDYETAEIALESAKQSARYLMELIRDNGVKALGQEIEIEEQRELFE